MIDLSGEWRAEVADNELRRSFLDRDFDDHAWHEVRVPGHWRSAPALAAVDGPVLYRRRFDSPTPGSATTEEEFGEGSRTFLELDGVFYQADVFFDGTYLGDVEGYFVQHVFEVTDRLTAATPATDHLLAIEVACTPQRDRKSKRNITGVFQHWDCIDPDWNPGGIWRPVRLRTTGPIRIDRFRVACVEADSSHAIVALRAMIDAKAPGKIKLQTVVGGVDHEQTLTVSAGRNRFEWRLTIPRPPLWWPHVLGSPTLVEMALVCTDLTTGQLSDQRTVRTGLRQVRANEWTFEINGERIFLKGANQGPNRMAIAELTAAEARTDLLLARDAGLDLIRLHGHISHPAIYDAADELGLLLWQDLPLQWGYARSVRKQAVRQAREAVDLLGRHPSIVQWSGHNEPLALNIDSDGQSSPKKAAQMKGAYAALQMLPTWNKSVLDFSIQRALTKADPSRPVSPHSGILPGPFSRGTDTHLYFGWYHGHERDLPQWLARVPRLARFLSEFGAQAVPNDAAFFDIDRWPNLDWDRIGHEHGLQKTFFDRYVPPARFPTFESWKTATQQYQAELLRRHIEELRRLKFRPSGGFALFSFADARDFNGVTWSVIGHDRQPKLGYEAVRTACRPVIVVADRLPATLAPGAAVHQDIHVVNDLRTNLIGAVVHASLEGGGLSKRWSWQGDIPANSCVRVGTITASVPLNLSVAPPHLNGALRDREANRALRNGIELALSLEHRDSSATNRYWAEFSPAK